MEKTIKEKDLYSDKKYFYKNFIRMCYDERHEKFIKGEFYEKD